MNLSCDLYDSIMGKYKTLKKYQEGSFMKLYFYIFVTKLEKK